MPADLYGLSDQTLLVFARSTCSACRRAAPFLQTAVDQARAADIPAWLVTAERDLSPEQDYAGTLGIEESHPARALELAADVGRRIDLVITDVVMPGGSGPDLVSTLRQQRPGLAACSSRATPPAR